jgi:hypothetical protein
MRQLGAFFVCTFALFAFVESARATPPTKEQLRVALSGYEDMPPAAYWQGLGDEAVPVLAEMYNDPTMPAYVRYRTVYAVAHYPIEATRTFLLAVARLPDQSDLHVRAALVSLARAFGERAIDDVRPFLEHREPVVREGAIQALDRIGTPRAVGLLRARLGAESARHLRRSIERAVAIERAPRR